MNTQIVSQQMIMIAIMITLGVIAYKTHVLDEHASKNISQIIVNITNPCLMIHSVLTSTEHITGKAFFIAVGITVLGYVILIVFGFLFPRLSGVNKEDYYAFELLSVYGNVGFIGIPLTLAVLGANSLIYVSFNNLVFNLLIYTLGDQTIRQKAGLITEGHSKKEDILRSVKGFINIGVLSSILAIILYVTNAQIPSLLMSTLDYSGRCTTFLSMLILGIAVAKINVREMVTNIRLYFFITLRYVLIPIVVILTLKHFVANATLLNTMTIMLALPAANMPLILATKYDVDAPVISQTIILSTLLSIITIPIVTMYV